MNNFLQMYIQYEIATCAYLHYTQIMELLSVEMSRFEAKNFYWEQVDTNPAIVIERCDIPSESHFHALKQFRKMEAHQVFGQLETFIIGGLETIRFFCVKKTNS
ncbi:hypothetical protein [Bacillus chungangensis]|uniref:Uncharacterized protein n=1 Tax=Bacillus chungangensis TaxID=587633 RepID=A0ABT9WRC6_9BACI|nr:hypothetical protein [Bacillus chungangensis]MDQ0175698.1 hypothetical protein [Bacillus chungangensis]